MRPQYRGCSLNKGFCSNIMIQSIINVYICLLYYLKVLAIIKPIYSNIVL